MAHRLLVEKYAEQLNAANKLLGTKSERIIELETDNADLGFRLEQAALTASSRPSDAGTTDASADDNAAATAMAWQKHLDKATDSDNNLRDELAKLSAEKGACETRIADLKEDNASISRDAADARAATKEHSGRITQLEGEIKTLRQARGNLQGQLTRGKMYQESLKQRVGGQRNFNISTSWDEDAAKTEVAKLSRSLDLEKRRRLEAEALLGPDGKRCKTCNPICVDLTADGEEGVEGDEALATAAGQTEQRASETSDDEVYVARPTRKVRKRYC